MLHEVAVVAVQDENSGEVPKAFIVKDDPNLTEDDVIKFCRAFNGTIKFQKYVEFVIAPKVQCRQNIKRARDNNPMNLH